VAILQVNILVNIYWQVLPRKLTAINKSRAHPLLLQKFDLLLNSNISAKARDVSILSLPIHRGLSTLPPNRAIIPKGVVIEGPLVVEDGQRFPRQVLR